MDFQQPGYLENFAQAIFNTIGPCAGKTLVVGGDLGLDRLGQYALAALIAAADEIDGIATSTARDKPDVIS